MCTNIDTVISLIVVYVIGFLCVALIGYRIGCWIGEKSAYKRFTKVCNECRNKKMNLSEKLTSSTIAFYATVRKSRTVGG